MPLAALLLGLAKLIASYWAVRVVAKIALAATVVTLVFTQSDNVVTAIQDYIAGLSDTTVLGQAVPIVGMMSYMGVFEAMSMLLGAHLAILSFRLVAKIVEWVS